MELVFATLLGIALGVMSGLMEAGLWIDPRRTEPANPSDHLLPLGILVGGEVLNGFFTKRVTGSQETTVALGIALFGTFLFAILVIAVIAWRFGIGLEKLPWAKRVK